MGAQNVENLIKAIRRDSPAKLKVYCGDDAKEFAVPNTRTKYARVTEALQSLDWSKAELLDKAGAILSIVSNDSRSPSSVSDAIVPAYDAESARDERMLNVMLRAQQSALANREAESKTALAASTEVIKVLVESVKQLAAIHREQMAAAVDAAESRAESEQSTEMSQLLEAAPLLIQALPHIRAAFASPVKLAQ